MTHAPTLFERIRNLLAEVYGDESSARRIATDAGLDLRRILFNGRVIDTWHSILLEARAVERIERLLNIALDEYGTNQSLQDLYAEFVERGLEAPIDEDAPMPGNSPYQGLEYFDVGDADRFFGREALTASVLKRLESEPFLAIIGASGSGKSSLARAGLVAQIQTGALPGSARWPVHLITPTAKPVERVAASLTRHSESVTATSTLMRDMRKDELSLHLYAQRLLETLDSDACLLLVVDQFEELFTLCNDVAEQQVFIDNLLTAVAEGRTRVVLTLRADFYARCARFDALRAAVATHQEYMGRMKPAELRDAIEKPAAAGGWALEEGLVDLLLREVGDEPGNLPLLSHALQQTWQRRRGNQLTINGYVAAGGIRGAIAQTADAVLRHMDPPQQELVRRIFLRLTELGEGSEDTRRRVSFSDLISGGASAEEVESVLHVLAGKEARLVTLSSASDAPGQVETETANGPNASAQTEVDVAHEALIRSWPQLRRWLDENRDDLRLHHHLSESAQAWRERDEDSSELYRGTRLDQAFEWAESHVDDLNEQEQAFLDASLAERQREIDEQGRIEREREEARQRDLENARALAAAAEEQRKIESARAQAEAERAQEAEARRKAADQARRRSRMAALAALSAVVVLLGFLGYLGWQRYGERGERALTEAFALQEQIRDTVDADTLTELTLAAKEKIDAAIAADPELENRIGVGTFVTDTLRLAATQLVHEGERLAANDDLEGAYIQFTAALALDELFADYAVPPEAPLYVLIEGGKFRMGSTLEEIEQGLAGSIEMSHTVSLDAYWIMRTEVTNGQYARCVEADGCRAPSNVFWNHPQNAKKPVIYVTWYQANDYAQFVGGRLPTEAEWEMACRSRDGRIYPWGNEDPDATRLNYNYNINSTTDVGSYPPGAHGLYDMAGNVWEWTNSLYMEYPYDPEDGRENIESDDFRTLRGGSFRYLDFNVRCAGRNSSPPLNGNDLSGFRVVVGVPPGF